MGRKNRMKREQKRAVKAKRAAVERQVEVVKKEKACHNPQPASQPDTWVETDMNKYAGPSNAMETSMDTCEEKDNNLGDYPSGDAIGPEQTDVALTETLEHIARRNTESEESVEKVVGIERSQPSLIVDIEACTPLITSNEGTLHHANDVAIRVEEVETECCIPLYSERSKPGPPPSRSFKLLRGLRILFQSIFGALRKFFRP